MAAQPSGKPQVQLLASAEEPSTWEHALFKSAQWSADGTTIFASSSSNAVHSYVVPPDLLEPREGPLDLKPQGTISLPEPTHAVAPCPYFSLSNPYTHVVLTAAVDHPIQLHQAFPDGPDTSSASPPRSPGGRRSSSPAPPGPRPPPLATYPLMHAPTESYLPSFSLLWPSPGTHFLAGTKNLIAYFDVTRSASGSGTAEPVLRLPTIPSTRHLAKGGGVGMRGAVSALALDPGSGLVAAGTWTRWMGLYDLSAGRSVANWSVAGAAAAGAGVLQAAWSPCGRYLVVAERRSAALLVYDVRVAGRLLGTLAGRDAETHQRMTCDVFPAPGAAAGFEVWAGGRDGRVAVWEGVGAREGDAEASWGWRAHSSAVGSTALHVSGSVVATCSGSWRIPGSGSQTDESDTPDSEDDGRPPRPRIEVEETSLRIWSVEAMQGGRDADSQ